jgi:hypothetical protein
MNSFYKEAVFAALQRSKDSYRKFYYILEKLERSLARREGGGRGMFMQSSAGRFREGYENTGLAKIQTKFEVGKFKFFKKLDEEDENSKKSFLRQLFEF